MRLDGNLYLGSMTANASLTILGQTSGPGRFCALGNKNQPIYVYLDNPANTFTGGVLVDSRAELIVGADGSLPANGDPVVVSNAVVRTENFSVGDRHLPDLELAGESTYRSFLSHADWKNVRKTTDGTSNWGTLSGAGSVSVEAGELKVGTPYVGSQADYWGFTKIVSAHDAVGMSWADFVGQATTVEGHTAGNWLFSYGTRSACNGFAGGVDGWVWWDGADNAAWDFVVAVDKAQGVYLEINGSPVYNWDNKSFAGLKLMTFADLDARRVYVRHGWNRLRCMMLSGTGNPGATKPVADGAAFQWLAGKEVLVNTTGVESTVQGDYIMLDDSNADGTQVMMGMLDDGDFSADSPYFGAVNVATGATLRYANAADAGAIGGTGTIVGDLTVSNVTASAANLTDALTVTGDVTLAEGAKVVVSDALLLKKVVDLPILTVTGALTAPDKIVCTSDSGKYNFTASVSADGKSLLLTARGPGLILLLR